MNRLAIFYSKTIGSHLFRKSLLIYSLISAVPITILAFMISYNVEKMLVEKQTLQINLLSYNLNNYLDQKYETFYDLIKQTYASRSTTPEFFEFIEKDLPNTSEEYYLAKNQFIAYFNNFFTTDNDLRNIVLYKKINEASYVLSKMSGDSYFSDEFLKERYTEHLKILKPTLIVNPAYTPKYSDQCVYSLSINLKQQGINVNSGILQLDYTPEGFEDELKKMSSDNAMGTFYIFTPDGKIIFDSSDQYYEKTYPYLDSLENGTNSIKINGEEYLINISRWNKFGLIVSNVIPKKLLFTESNLIKSQILFITLLCILAVIILTRISASSFSKRIKTITEAMNQVKIGNLNAKIKTTPTGDEINTIASNFNAMCLDLSEYINQVYIYEINKKNAEIEALQSQINPHFIYNTLEAIRMSAVSQGESSVSQMIFLLAKLFRNIVKEDNIISIETEVNNSQLYLDLFKFRYNNKFTYDIQIPADVRLFAIPKHTLQPIIENFMVHGYDLKKEVNHISIRCTKELDDILIEISDNGLGIDKERLLEIQNSLNSLTSISRSHIGLKNVHERIKLIYGWKYGLTITSEQYVHTTITLRIASKTVTELLKHEIK